MAEFGFDLEEIARLIRIVEERGLASLEVEAEVRLLRIRGARPGAVQPPHSGTTGLPLRAVAPSPASPVPAEEDLLALTSPMVGVFYRAAAPDVPPLVEEGDRIEVGQPIGVIEAMKVFSEIPSESAGIVVRIAAQNGALVKQGEPLLFLRQE